MKNYCEELVTLQDREIAKELRDIAVRFIPDETGYRLKLYSKVPLSVTEVVMLLHDFGIEVRDQLAYAFDGVQVDLFTIKTDFPKLTQYYHLIESILKEALLERAPKRCVLYRFVSLEGFDLERIIFLRAIIKYLDQLLLQKREESIAKIFLAHHGLVSLIVTLFFKKGPSKKEIQKSIEELFKEIKSFEEDKILKIFYHTVQNIVKTNFFDAKEARSFKFDIANFKDLLGDLQPNIEMFVYHQDFLGVHLRADKVSRGGIRWSDREDFREEIKSLMITQEAKNAIIVPAGGKGGLRIDKKVDKEGFRHYYILYIDALLDLIDNTPQPGKDFYFVVAADKGTAQMSDTANEIAKRRGYWLADAFASGGSHGYNHKKLGVTAKGAWRAAARHFVARDIDIFRDPISVVGVGSMRGDVFGNGMLINPNIRLLGAISSHEIFIDPDPDPTLSYQERKRLFEVSKGWSDYDPAKISPGGGVFARDAKEISLTPQMKKLLGTKRSSLSGDELVRKLLCLHVDLLYIGGIGTYVKSSEELNIHIADKINEPVRVDASDLRAYAVCEGGNLGLTQKARIEYAKNGGKINLDHIDNSAGVNTSDYEVNIKIALGKALQEGKIDEESRNETLQKLTHDVLSKVFETNFAQSLAITLDELRSKESLEEFIKSIDILERNLEYFKRKDYAIPKNKEMATVLSPQGGLVRPILGILLSYAKLFVKKRLLASKLLEEPFFEHYLYKYFPKSLVPTFEKEIVSHPLGKEIRATVIANIIINNAGASFISDYEELGEEKFLLKIRSYLLLYTLLSIAKYKKGLYDKESELKERLYDELLEIEDSVEFGIKWIIRNYHEINTEPFHILNYKKEIAEFMEQEKGALFAYSDLIKFVMLAISLKELREYRLKEVLGLLERIITTFKVDQLLGLVYAFKPKDQTGRELKNQLVDLIELFVATIAKDVVLFTRSRESLLEGFENYIKEKMIDPLRYATEIEQLTPSDLMKLTNIVHKLLLEAV